jgi:hypothetical protein
MRKLRAFLRWMFETRRRPVVAEPAWDEIEEVNRELAAIASSGQAGEVNA